MQWSHKIRERSKTSKEAYGTELQDVSENQDKVERQSSQPKAIQWSTERATEDVPSNSINNTEGAEGSNPMPSPIDSIQSDSQSESDSSSKSDTQIKSQTEQESEKHDD